MGKGKMLLKGRGGSAGVVVATVRIVDKDEEKMEKLEPGEIMVAERTKPEHVPYMKKAGAFVTDIGGLTAHTLIVAREMGKPAVVGTLEATTILQDGQKVVVDGFAGYEEYKTPSGEIGQRPYGAVYEYIEEAPAAPPVVDLEKFKELAEKRHIPIPPEIMKRLTKGE